MRPKADVLDELDVPGFSVGSASTLTERKGFKPTPRQFHPGFHGANPGPSHDEDAPPPRKRRAKES